MDGWYKWHIVVSALLKKASVKLQLLITFTSFSTYMKKRSWNIAVSYLIGGVCYTRVFLEKVPLFPQSVKFE